MVSKSIELSEPQKEQAKKMVDAFLPDFLARLSPVLGGQRRYQLEYAIDRLTSELKKTEASNA
jgi:hypothetical protein